MFVIEIHYFLCEVKTSNKRMSGVKVSLVFSLGIRVQGVQPLAKSR